MVKEGRERSQDVMGIVLSLLLRAFLFSSRLPSRENLPFSRGIDSSGFSNVKKKGKKEKKKEGKVTRWFENRLEVSKVWREGG